jgi:hypothetical protein
VSNFTGPWVKAVLVVIILVLTYLVINLGRVIASGGEIRITNIEVFMRGAADAIPACEGIKILNYCIGETTLVGTGP